MPTPAFCALDAAYGDWDNNKIKKQESIYQEVSGGKIEKEPEYVTTKLEPSVREFCPNCNNCINANNRLQQDIIDQNNWPRPRWVPQQYPGPYVAFDPYNRYWASITGPPRREDFMNFGNIFEPFANSGVKNNNDVFQGILQLIMFILVALFILQLFELFSKTSSV